MSDITKLDKPQTLDLSKIDPSDTHKADKDSSKIAVAQLAKELCELQEWLYAAQTHSVLIVLQGLDTSGKDGTIAHVMEGLNPQGCEVASFKVPTQLEQAHDFLWRTHAQAPARGMMTIFNRSHYEDVLVTRVHKMISKEVCEDRYGQIIGFEKLLADSHTIILKFFLHISKDEQKERLLAREKDEEKAWKLSTGDWEERQYWNAYTAAYQEALGATGAKTAPWYVVPANHKWHRNLVVAQTIVQTLRPYKDEWVEALKKIGQERKEELAQMRATEGTSKPTSDKSQSKTH